MIPGKNNAPGDWNPMGAAFESETPPGGQPGGGSAGPAGRACGHRGQRAVTDPPFSAKGFLPCCARR